MLSVEMTSRSYSGRKGCMCGCRGSYKETEKARKSAITNLLKDPETKLLVWGPREAREGCLYKDTDQRTRALYLNSNGVEACRKLGIPEE